MDPETIIIISNISIKNNVTTLISHICSGQNIYVKTIYYTVNITFTEVELFTIRCSINQAVYVQNVTHIIVITDVIHSTRQIFDLFFHPYQFQSITISQDLKFIIWLLTKRPNDSITFLISPVNHHRT